MYKHDLPDDNLYDGIDDSYNDFEIDVKVGDTVISKTPYVFYGKTEIDVGEKWLVFLHPFKTSNTVIFIKS